MKSTFFNQLLIPIWIILIVSIGSLYWGFQFHAGAHDAEIKYNHLNNAMSLVECPTLNKNVVLAIARTSYTHGQQLANILFAFSFFLFMLGFGNLVLVWKHLKRSVVSGADLTQPPNLD